ncbi:hypothetical protein [Candidatus Contubernalis alkaliaceticus]|nr:hypothetical protein [Candidatus Contubernalis alkalaceticus]
MLPLETMFLLDEGNNGCYTFKEPIVQQQSGHLEQGMSTLYLPE